MTIEPAPEQLNQLASDHRCRPSDLSGGGPAGTAAKRSRFSGSLAPRALDRFPRRGIAPQLSLPPLPSPAVNISHEQQTPVQISRKSDGPRKAGSGRNTDVPNCARGGRAGNLERCRPRQSAPWTGLWGRPAAMKATAGSKTAQPIFIGRWTPKILFALNEKPCRHGQLRRRVGMVSQRMLTRTLRKLESTGLVARRVKESKIVAVEYSLTPTGKTIIAPLGGMCRWARRHRRRVSAEVPVVERQQ